MTMDALHSLVETIMNGNKRDVLLIVLAIVALFAIPLFLSSLVASSTANAGFNIVFTALLNICFVAGAYYVIQNSKTPIAIGFLVGCSSMLSALNFMDAVYWGQLSHCVNYDIVIGQYSCSHPYIYGAICFFSVVLFLTELCFVCGVYIWRGELISEDGVYESVSNSSSFEHQSRMSNFSHAQPSADL